MNTKKTKPKGHWKVKDKCKEVALKYKRRSDFKKGDEGAYESCWKNGWLEEVCSHMKGCRKTLTF
jgi:hypothetical protein